MKVILPLLLFLVIGCEDKITESETQIVDRPTACPSPNPELEQSEFNFAGVTEVSDINRTSAVISWEENSNFHQFFVVSVGQAQREILGTAEQGSSSFTIKGLTPNTNYKILVRAIDQKGFLEPNDKTLSFTTLPWPNFSNLKSLRFNSSQAVQLGESSKFDLGSAFTISTWVKQNETPQEDQRIFSFHRKSKSSSALSLGVKGNGAIHLVYQNQDDTQMTFSFDADFADSKWHQFVLVNDLEFLRLYVDGNLLFKLKDNLQGVTGTHQAHIGSLTGIQKGFKGQIDEFAFFQKALDDNDVIEIYNGGSAYDLRGHNGAPTLKHWYRFGDSSQDSPSVIEDVVGNRNAIPFNIVESDFTTDSP
ncbi:MAG: hypothetical protein CME65_10035 [Halobacteriovoraceae bacterium]|nr:hypothetical protein [Halobacteriovoraceae bacterium]|tara:strand:+ start:4340 stop:5428 length:1089 start_codon:yes stop_codon:yes gene_type:complete